MSRQHFVMIARIVASITDADVRRAVALDFAAELRATNPRFDRARFLRACGVQS